MLACACARKDESGAGPASSAAPVSSAHSPAPTATRSAEAPPAPRAFVLVAAGDVELARDTGRRLLREPSYDPFARVQALLRAGDARFVNLESQLSDQKGEVMSKANPLVFTGPPGGADALARARIDVVSTANNHAWDYGKRAMEETLANLDRVGVAHVGTSAEPGVEPKPVVVVRGGFRLGFLAFTGIWNQGPLEKHEARAFVAGASRDAIASAVKKLAASGTTDAIAVSLHAGEEYQDRPLAGVQEMARAAIEAGAHAVIGHHAHVMQGVELVQGRPIFYGLGNFVMRMHRDHRWTELGLVARIRFRADGPPEAWVCPVRIDGAEPEPLTASPSRAALERLAFDHLRAITAAASNGTTSVGPAAQDGCAPVSGR